MVWRKLPDRPACAAWLPAGQGEQLERRLASEADEVLAGTGGRGAGMFAGFRDRQVLLAIFVYFCHQLAIYTVIFFLPSIVASYGHRSDLAVGCLSALPWLVSAVGAVWLPRRADSPRRSLRLLVVGLLLMALGLWLAACSGAWLAMLGFCLSAGMFFAVQAVIFTYPASRLAGAGLAAGLAFVNTCGLFGGFLGPSMMGAIEAHTGSTRNGLLVIGGLLLIAALAATRLRQGRVADLTSDRLSRAS